MKLSMTGQMRMEQRMKLAPRMIQSMEILQLPAMALLEKIEAELNSNPVLEVENDQTEAETNSDEKGEVSELDTPAETTETTEDFEDISPPGDTYDDYVYRNDIANSRRYDSSEPDKKLEAMNNTADAGLSLHEYLSQQWRLVEADEKVKTAGQSIIDYIDEKGYLKVQPQQLYSKDRDDFELADIEKALKLVQELEPAGVGAKDVRQCLAIQMAQMPEDMSFEIELVDKHMEKLLENKLPEIAKKMNTSLKRISQAIQKMRVLDTSPGLQISKIQNHPIRPDVIVEPKDDESGYSVYLAETSLPNLRVNQFYADISKDKKIDTKTRHFLKDNIRSAQWLMDAIEQRKNTLLRVSRAVVNRQAEFFDKGQKALKPLPMSVIADEVGVHVATVSRAVAGKYIQSPQGISPLRDLFSGGMDTNDGQSESFEAIRAKMQQIIDSENKLKPLSDDAIRKLLEDTGINNIARRTVAKYRKIMNIPTARFRKRY
ncbi:MAG: RNA polymerase factor sigma-54 [Anaerohalosphaeraceae bacterium]|nr:RNA polymerase factor sigma-54 [Anaerohalosphaeraceae bacterium]